jgi:endonuclease-3
MQDPPIDRRVSGKFAVIAGRLADDYGSKVWRSSGPPLDELIATILSQHTSDTNSARAYASLRAAFPNWREVVASPTAAVADAIRSGGLADLKAPRIQAILREIELAAGDLSLDWLATLPMSEARAWLVALPGVGPKTASCVLLFSLGRPAMPVDTHVYRVGRRLGIIPAEASPERAHECLQRIVGPDRDAMLTMHLNLITHGRAVCRARNPACFHCVLADVCPSAQTFDGTPTR